MIRLLEKTDYHQYYLLINEFRQTSFNKEEFCHYLDKLPSNIHIYVLIESNRIIATTTVIYEPKLIFNLCTFAHIEDVCVLKEFHKYGYGSKLLKHVVEEAKKNKCYKVTLVCNESVLPFYLRNSFEKRGVQCSILL
jgi:GNAT superfamily N-acetyltransferase